MHCVRLESRPAVCIRQWPCHFISHLRTSEAEPPLQSLSKTSILFRTTLAADMMQGAARRHPGSRGWQPPHEQPVPLQKRQVTREPYPQCLHCNFTGGQSRHQASKPSWYPGLLSRDLIGGGFTRLPPSQARHLCSLPVRIKMTGRKSAQREDQSYPKPYTASGIRGQWRLPGEWLTVNRFYPAGGICLNAGDSRWALDHWDSHQIKACLHRQADRVPF